MGNFFTTKITLKEIWTLPNDEINRHLHAAWITPSKEPRQNRVQFARFAVEQQVLKGKEWSLAQMTHFPQVLLQNVGYDEGLEELRRPFAQRLMTINLAMTTIHGPIHNTTIAIYSNTSPMDIYQMYNLGDLNNIKFKLHLASTHLVDVDEKVLIERIDQIKMIVNASLQDAKIQMEKTILPPLPEGMTQLIQAAWRAQFQSEVTSENKTFARGTSGLHPVNLIDHLLSIDISHVLEPVRSYYLAAIYEMLMLCPAASELYKQWETKIKECKCEQLFAPLSLAALPLEAACLNTCLLPTLGIVIAQYLSRPPTYNDVLARLIQPP